MEISFLAISIIVGILGLVVGSFLNVVILRHDSSEGLGGRSHCPKCKHQLAWYELIPVVSFIIQLGKCRACKSRISFQYISVELFTAIIFFVSTWFLLGQYSYLVLLKQLLIIASFLLVVSVAISITVYDIRNKLVPLSWFLGLVGFSVVFLVLQYWLGGYASLVQYILSQLLGLVVVIPFLAIWLFSHGKYMGFADIELIAWMGLFFGLSLGTAAVIVSFYAGALFAIVFIIYQRLRGRSYSSVRKIAIPFAPFLFLGWFIVFLTHTDIISLVSGLLL